MSKGYLCRRFRQHVGMSVFDYLTHRRVEAAMQALRGTDAKILTLAMEAGFGDLSHFNRTFKARTGVSPSAYRRGDHG